MKNIALALAAAALASPALAQDGGWDLSGEFGVATDYVSKGVSKTNGDGQIFVGGEAAHGDFYIAPWISNADFGPGADAEIKLTAGWAPQAWGVEWNLAAIGKFYPGTKAGASDSMIEYHVDASRSIGPASARLAVEYTPDNYGGATEAWWVEARAGWRLSPKAKLTGALGRREQDGGADYTAWNAGVNYALTERLSGDLRWYDTDGADEFGKNYDSRVVAGLELSF